MLGHTRIESTVRYLGIEIDDALAIAEQVDVRNTGAERTCSAHPLTPLCANLRHCTRTTGIKQRPHRSAALRAR